MDSNTIISLAGSAVMVATMLITNWFKDRKEQRQRVQDRLDRESAAEIARKKLEVAAKLRETRIVNEVKQVKTVAVQSMLKNEEAIRVSNGHTEKTIAATEAAAKASEAAAKAAEIAQRVLEKPLPVEVVNPASNPVHVSQD